MAAAGGKRCRKNCRWPMGKSLVGAGAAWPGAADDQPSAGLAPRERESGEERRRESDDDDDPVPAAAADGRQ